MFTRALTPLLGLLVCWSCSVLAAEPAVVEAPSAVEWRTLFNGRNLDGWDGDERLWSVRDGAIRGETTPERKAARICLAGKQAEWTPQGKRVTGQLIDAAGFAKLFRLDDWNDVRIVAQGNRLQHFLNGTPILDFTDDDAHAIREGILAFQLHAGAPMWAEFRDIRVRPLPAE